MKQFGLHRISGRLSASCWPPPFSSKGANVDMTIAEGFSIGKDVIIVIAAVAAAGVGIRGLNTWRRQLTANSDIELAKKILMCLYELKALIEVLRQPYKSYPLVPDLPPEKLEELSQEQAAWHIERQVYQRLWSPIPTVFARLNPGLWEGEALWVDGFGKGISAKVRQIEKLVMKVRYSVEEHLHQRDPDLKQFEKFTDEKRWNDLRKTLFSTGKDDELQSSFDEILSGIEAELHTVVRKHRA